MLRRHDLFFPGHMASELLAIRLAGRSAPTPPRSCQGVRDLAELSVLAQKQCTLERACKALSSALQHSADCVRRIALQKPRRLHRSMSP
eukprot:s2239_g5.t1